MKKIAKLRVAYFTSTGFLDFVFHIGYQGLTLLIWLRRLFARTRLHKSWLSGFYGGGIIGIEERQQNNKKEPYHTSPE
jgi:hypothetical protein